MSKTTAEVTDKMLLKAYKDAIGFDNEANFARWLGVSRQRLNGWMNGNYRVSDLWIIQHLNDDAAPARRKLAEELMVLHARKARMN